MFCVQHGLGFSRNNASVISAGVVCKLNAQVITIVGLATSEFNIVNCAYMQITPKVYSRLREKVNTAILLALLTNETI